MAVMAQAAAQAAPQPAALAGAHAADALRASAADRAALAEVLSRPEFRRPASGSEALRRLLLDLWDSLLERLGTAEAERYASAGRLIFFLALLVAALLAWRAVRRRRPGAARPAAAGQTPAWVTERAEPPRAAAAAEALGRGDLAGAVRAAFGAAAAGLAARGLAPGGEALTGRELAARAGDEGFDALAGLHERTVFGRRPVSAEEAQASVETARRIEPRRVPGARR